MYTATTNMPTLIRARLPMPYSATPVCWLLQASFDVAACQNQSLTLELAMDTSTIKRSWEATCSVSRSSQQRTEAPGKFKLDEVFQTFKAQRKGTDLAI